MLVRFLKQPSAFSGGSDFVAGEVYELDDPSAYRWIRRGVAEEVEPQTADAAPASRRRRGRKPASPGARKHGSHTDGKT